MVTDEIEPTSDERDGVLFRFWCRASAYPGGWPLELMKLFEEVRSDQRENMRPEHYRAALIELAKRKGVNLP
jgi:hypothetical protein